MDFKEHLIKAFEDAENNKSKIDDFIINMVGMSGIKTRHFYNNIANFDDCRYLEIGSYKGSTACAALCNNKMKYFVCIDNWSEFGNNKNEFMHNFNNYKGDNNAYYIENDCFKLDKTNFKNKFNVYMYDGSHSDEDQYKAIEYYYNVLDDTFIFIVDDWNSITIRNATLNAINDFKLKIIHKIEVRLNEDDGYTEDRNGYHNGIFVAVLQK
jgi:hypothetical protein